ncbi:MAG: hypothetical protein J3Q66DRAFT_409213 [Benniella sp.]|nr:MAG: hypothetical protein J3Q66DRAFT_409213 [Benniella sp.]
MTEWYLLKYNITNAYTLHQTIFVYLTMTISMIVIGIVNWYAQGLNVKCTQVTSTNYTSACQPRTFYSGERFDGANFTFTFLRTNDYRGEALVCWPNAARDNLWVRGIPISNPYQEWDYEMHCERNIQVAVHSCNNHSIRGQIIYAAAYVSNATRSGIACGTKPVNSFSLVQGVPYVYSDEKICGAAGDPVLEELRDSLNSRIASDLNGTIPDAIYTCNDCVYNHFDISVLFKLIVSVLAFATILRLVVTRIVDRFYHIGHGIGHNIGNTHPVESNVLPR